MLRTRVRVLAVSGRYRGLVRRQGYVVVRNGRWLSEPRLEVAPVALVLVKLGGRSPRVAGRYAQSGARVAKVDMQLGKLWDGVESRRARWV